MTDEASPELGLKELREFWHEQLADGSHLTCDDIRARLRSVGKKAKGADRKGEIKNIHAAVTKDERFEKVTAGVFRLKS